MDKHVNGAIADLSSFMPQDVASVEIVAPDGITGTGWLIEMAGPSHPKTIAWNEVASRRALRKQAQIEAATVNGRKFKPDDREPDDVRRENVDWVVSRIVGWSPVRIAAVQPEPIAFSAEAATSLFLRPDMGWAFTQLVEALASERSFTRASARS